MRGSDKSKRFRQKFNKWRKKWWFFEEVSNDNNG